MAAIEGRSSGALSPKARNATWGAFFGFFVDIFDIYLPVVVLAPALIYFIPPELSATTTALVGGTIFAATLVGRPLGALIFGHYADRFSRKQSTIVAVSGFGAVTLLIAFLPGYEQLGFSIVILFILLRFIAGIFLGGEYTAASPLAMEYCPKEKRGFYGAFIMTGFPLAYAFISLITFFLLVFIPAGDINSPYVQWGWRIPFVFGAFLAFAFVVYYLYFVEESEIFRESGGNETPIRSLFSGDNLKNFLQVFVLMSGLWLALQPVSAVLPGLLGDPVGLSGTGTTFTLVIANVLLAFGYIAAGVISQRIGRRPFLILMGALIALPGTFFYYLLISLEPGLTGAILLTTITVILVVSSWGLAVSYITERFQTGVRASGFGLGYSLAVIIPSFYAYFQVGLGLVMPFNYTALPLVAVGGILVIAGAAWGPETRDVDFAQELESEQATESSPDGSQTVRAPRKTLEDS